MRLRWFRYEYGVPVPWSVWARSCRQDIQESGARLEARTDVPGLTKLPSVFSETRKAMNWVLNYDSP